MEHLGKLENIEMIDPTPNEETASMDGMNAAWAYLQSIGKTDLASLDRDEAKTYALCFVGGYCDKMAEFNDIPF